MIPSSLSEFDAPLTSAGVHARLTALFSSSRIWLEREVIDVRALVCTENSLDLRAGIVIMPPRCDVRGQHLGADEVEELFRPPATVPCRTVV